MCGNILKYFPVKEIFLWKIAYIISLKNLFKN